MTNMRTCTKYEIPEVVVLTPAISSIQSISGKHLPPILEAEFPESVAAYQDYEE
jgi:hypothetical protein